MHLILYEKAMYPSGWVHGEVMRENPACASIGLSKAMTKTKGKVIANLPDGMYLAQAFNGGTIRGIHFGEDDGEAHAPPTVDILNPKAVKREKTKRVHLTNLARHAKLLLFEVEAARFSPGGKASRV